MNKKGLTFTLIFIAESANYGEGIGNITSLKKISRGTGDSYTYISRQALRYNIINQMLEYGKYSLTEIQKEGSGEKSVIQFKADATIRDYPEIDLFGYMKTVKGEASKTRPAVIRLSNAVSLEPFNGDLDFLTNKGLADRKGFDSNIAQSEIHRSYYTYSIAVDLDKIGIDDNDNIEINNKEKFKRMLVFLKAVKFLYRDIRGRRENLSPLFTIGGVYEIKNPFFENRISLEGNNLSVECIKDVLNFDEDIKENTLIGYVKGTFKNDPEIREELQPLNIQAFFERLNQKVKQYYNA